MHVVYFLHIFFLPPTRKDLSRLNENMDHFDYTRSVTSNVRSLGGK